jgi:serine/threonine protein kinase
MGEKLGSYVLEERVARGGMGEVWRARGPDGAVVCIKRLDPSLRNDVDFIEMFRDEASLVADLDHENVIKMFELIDTDEELAQVMEYVDGASLARIRGALSDDGAGFSVEEALQIGVYLCRALHHAHTRTRDGVPGGEPLAIVHRDVSPQNILIDKRGKLKLVDFGIAKAAQRLTRTSAGTLKGKLIYMAPEQARGDGVDARADQFAAGILVWEMLTGRRLFGGRNEMLILDQVQKSDPVPPSTVKKNIPRSVDKAVLRALRWHQEERFADMAMLERALQACLEEVSGRKTVDLSALVTRTLAKEPEATAAKMAAQGGVVRTRVLSSGEGDTSEQANASTVEKSVEKSESGKARAAPPFITDPLAQPEHTGQFFQRRSTWTAANIAAAAAGVVVIAGLISGALWLAERDPVDATPTPTPAQAAAQTAQARLDDLEKRLEEAPTHPCRTELLDDLLDKSPLQAASVDSLAAAVDACVKMATDAPKLRAQLKSNGKLNTPPWPKKKKRTAAVIAARAAEMARRGQLALAAGEYERGKELLVEAVTLDPSRVDDHAALAQAFRGLGDPAGAGYHLRLYFHVHPDDVDRERAERYLRRYNQSTELKPSAEPSIDEKHVRVARFLADAARVTDDKRRAALLDAADALLPGDPRVKKARAALAPSN